MECGWTHRQIGERLGVAKRTVAAWWRGEAVPGDYAVLTALARMTRTARPPVQRIYGMQRVVVELCAVLKLSRRGLMRRIGRREEISAHWMAGRYGPGRLSTLRLLKLVRDNGLGETFERLCERRLEELWRTDQRRKK